MRYGMRNIIMTLVLSPLGFGCNFHEDKTDGQDSTTTPTTVDPAKLGFAEVRAAVFQPKCFSCHSAAGGNSAGLNLESFASASERLSTIRKRAVEQKNMPLGGSLSSDQLATLSAWIDAGGPEMASTPAALDDY